MRLGRFCQIHQTMMMEIIFSQKPDKSFGNFCSTGVSVKSIPTNYFDQFRVNKSRHSKLLFVMKGSHASKNKGIRRKYIILKTDMIPNKTV